MASTPNDPAEQPGRFALLRCTELPLLGVTLEEYRHEPSGARHLHLASGDPVNAFMLGVLTPPLDDSGLTHVLEHMVLCGGRGFAARRAFFSMLWRSACLTMNAFASDDCTGYHFATRHPRDFANLLRVYLDCVFRPRLDLADFHTEAHRTVAGSGGGALRPGVVLNEMRGVMSEPHARLQAAVARHLFTDSAYRFNTGGDPACMPRLELSRVRAYHHRCYHPARALFMSSGNIAAVAHQAHILAIAFDGWGDVPCRAPDASHMEPSALAAPITRSEPGFAGTADGDARAQVAVAWLLGSRTLPRDVLEARLLDSVSLAHSASPLRRVLEDGRFEGRPSRLCGLDESRRRLSLCAALEDACADDAAGLQTAVLEAVSRQVRAGVESAEVEMAMDRLERAMGSVGSRRYPHGLDLLARLLTPVLHGGDPVAHLDLRDTLRDLRTDLSRRGYLESRMQALMLENPHRLLLTLLPGRASRQAGRGSTRDESTGMGEPVPDPSPPLAGEPLPELAAADLEHGRGGGHESWNRRDGTRVHACARPCAGVVHQVLAVSVPALPGRLRMLPPLLLAGLGHLARGTLSARDSAVAIARAGNGLQAHLRIACRFDDLCEPHAAVILRSVALPRHCDALAALMVQALEQIRFDDLEQLRAVLSRARAGLRETALAQGHLTCRRLAAAGTGAAAALVEQWQGGGALSRLSALLDARDGQRMREVAEDLARLRDILAQSPREALVVADERVLPQAARSVERYQDRLRGEPDDRLATVQPDATPAADRAIQVDLPVGHCARVVTSLAPAHEHAPALAVMGAMLGPGVLHESVREGGGAYGAGAGYCLDTGAFHLFSYRDPDPLGTLLRFDRAMAWLARQLAGAVGVERAIDRAKLAVIGQLQRSESMAQACMASFEDRLVRPVTATGDFLDAVLAVDTAACSTAFAAHLRPAVPTSVVMAAEAALAHRPRAMRVQPL